MPTPDFNRWHRHFGGPPASSAAPGGSRPTRQEARRAEAPSAPLELPMEKFLPREPRPHNPHTEVPPLFRWLALAGTGTGFLIAWALVTFR